MAKEWLIQLEDGIWCPDVVQKKAWKEWYASFLEVKWFPEYVPKTYRTSEWMLVEIGGLLADIPRLRTVRSQRTFHQRSFIERPGLFEQIWYGLCTRSTTKREDLTSIIAILLGFRPAEIARLPENSRVLSLLCAQGVLPLCLAYRQRPILVDWSSAYKWLPLEIEEVPIEISPGEMCLTKTSSFLDY